MTDLPIPLPGGKKLGLVIDLDVCVGCHACATACKAHAEYVDAGASEWIGSRLLPKDGARLPC